MGLVAHDPVDDVDARVLEGLGPPDVRGLVEPRLQLDERGDLLAGLRGADERRDDRAVTGGPVERVLDAEHVGVVGRLGDERLDRVGERVVGVVQQHVALAQHREDVRALVVRRQAVAAG